MKTIRNPLTLALALGASLAMPMAFAQSTSPTPASPTEQYQQTQPPANSATPPTSTADDAAASTGTEPAGEAKQLTWADVDADGNGTISKTESSALPSLAQVFEQADSDANGELTADEYKAFVAANASGGATDSGG